MDISVVIPAYNEEKRIVPTLEKVCKYFSSSSLVFEIIVVDDGSSDGTVAAVNKKSEKHSEVKVLRHAKNRGKGAAVKTGVLKASGDLILFTDADLSTPIEEFEKLCKEIDKGFDIAIASRAVKGAVIAVPQPLYRRLIGRIFPFLVRLIVFEKFRDTQCGFKLFKREAGLFLFSRLVTEGFAFDVEIIYRAVKKGLKVNEVPVRWVNSSVSTVNIFRDPFRMFAALFTIRAHVR
ncbi:MAG TPA: glycosyltransferase family 2 protein [bacterium]|nr:glycosyltransferase family 2 protein [bacterium]